MSPPLGYWEQYCNIYGNEDIKKHQFKIQEDLMLTYHLCCAFILYFTYIVNFFLVYSLKLVP